MIRRDVAFGPEYDDVYAELLQAYAGLDKTQSDAFTARLVLLLLNQVGDRAVISAILDAAKPKQGAG